MSLGRRVRSRVTKQMWFAGLPGGRRVGLEDTLRRALKEIALTAFFVSRQESTLL